MHAANPKVSRAMAMFQIRRYLTAKAPGAKLSAADILDYIHAAKAAAQPTDRLQTLISAIEFGLNIPSYEKMYTRIVKVAAKQNPDIPDIEGILVQIIAVISRYSEVYRGDLTVSLALNQPQFR